jgi:hypothetical protein
MLSRMADAYGCILRFWIYSRLGQAWRPCHPEVISHIMILLNGQELRLSTAGAIPDGGQWG